MDGGYDDTSGTKAKHPKSQTVVINSLPGSPSTKCVEVGKGATVRSGKIAMGDFAAVAAELKKVDHIYDAPQSYFYVIPVDPKVSKVTVVATKTSGKAGRAKVTSKNAESAAQWTYFPIHMQITSYGTWQFKVSAGEERGCFEMRFRHDN